MTTQIRLRRDIAANWTNVNPVLALGEPGIETDTRKIKYGDGTTAWNSLEYSASSEPGPAGPQGEPGAKGDKGDTGENGLNGLNGEIGQKGDTGDTGPKGDKGDTGAQGASVILKGTLALISDLNNVVDPQQGDAWIVTESNGGDLYFYDSFNQWDNIGKIVGPKGDKGDTGDQGPRGDTGPAGENGLNGENGLPGTNGENGTPGAPGVGVPTGGTSGQVLAKIDSTDYNTEWVNQTGGASTGNVTFNDINVIGTGNLKLQPNSFDSGAYIDVFLTSGPDVHMASNSQNIIIGRDTGANVTVGISGDVTVRADAGTAHDWTFGNDGKLTFPDGSTQTTAYVTPVQLGFFDELKHTSDNNALAGEAVAMDAGGNSFVSYSYYDQNQNTNVGGVMKFSSAGTKLWSTNISSQNSNAGYIEIVSLEYSVVNSNPTLIAFGQYYDNVTNKDVGVMYYINPNDGSVGSLLDVEITSANGIRLIDGVFGFDSESAPFAVVVGESYSEVLLKTFTPLAPSTTDKLYVSWSEFNASNVQSGENLTYTVGGYYNVKMNGSDTVASPDGTGDGIYLTISAIEGGTYTVTRVNGWSGVINGWTVPVTLRVLGSNLGGADGVNDFTFDFDSTVFADNSNNITAAISNKQGTPIENVYCQAFNGKDWGAEIGNTLTFNYELNDQAYIARFGTEPWSKSLGATNYDRLNSVVVDTAGNAYAVGYVYNGTRGAAVIKYNTAGVQQWAVYVDSSSNMGNSIISVDLLADGNLIVVDENGTVTKLNNTSGEIIWQVTIDSGPSWNGDFKGTATPNGDYIFTNWEDNNYTMYVMRISGTDGSSMWTKQISRSYGGNNGDVTAEDDFNAQYIDCNDTHVTIAGSTYLNGNSSGLVFSFPIDGAGIDGSYGQYTISSQSLNYNIETTTAVAATVNITTGSASTNSASPTGNSSNITVTKTNIGAADTEAPVLGIARYSASAGDNNVTLAADQNGKFLYYYGTNGNSWIYIPSENDDPLPIGYTVTVVMDAFGGNRIYVNNQTGSQNATINAIGFSDGTSNYWQFGADGNCGIYTIMKVDTDRWMLAGPDVQVD